MAGEQREKASLTARMKRKKNPAEMLNMEVDSSDGEAPEEMTFEDSKIQALRSMNDALETIRREKELQKEKRRRRQELFQEQKKKKLPVEVLEEIGATASKKEGIAKGEGGEKQPEVKVVAKKKKRCRKPADSKKLMGTYEVTTRRDELASFQQQAAEDFLKSRLYGPESRRSTNNEILSLQNKKGEIKSAAVQFVKKDWAPSHKAKAEKMKKRWIHKQQLLT